MGLLTPDYADPTTPQPRRRWYRASLACGIVPLAVGVGTTGLYWLTLWRPLILVGLAVLVGGCVSVFTGFACLKAYLSGARRNGTVGDEELARQRTVAGGFLAANLFAGPVCALAGMV